LQAGGADLRLAHGKRDAPAKGLCLGGEAGHLLRRDHGEDGVPVCGKEIAELVVEGRKATLDGGQQVAVEPLLLRQRRET